MAALTHLHTRRASLPFPAQTAQRHALMIRRFIAVHKAWMHQNPTLAAGKDHLRGLVADFREACRTLDEVMAPHTNVVALRFGRAA